MPEVTLNIPGNSKFHSSLNEVDLAMQQVLLNQMRIADPRNITGEPDSVVNTKNPEYLWDNSRVFQVDELNTEEIFNTFLLRKKINNKKGVDVTYPILGFKQDDIQTVFWGTGNRFRQWYLDVPTTEEDFEIGDEVGIICPGKYKGNRATIVSITKANEGLEFTLELNGHLITVREKNKTIPVIFSQDDVKLLGEKQAGKYKAKAITCTYSAAILVDNRDEAQYIRDGFILNCADGQIWHKYFSPTIQSENQIFTVFENPNLDRYPSSSDKLKGQGYIYGIAFKINVWACLTRRPLPQNIIETIRLNVHVENDGITNRIVINA